VSVPAPCSIAELSAKSGLPQSDLLDLVARYPAMATLEPAGVCSGLEGGCFWYFELLGCGLGCVIMHAGVFGCGDCDWV
jgi:hypothetical protein